MFGNLAHLTDTQLLTYLLDILCKPMPITARDVTEIEQIDREFIRRGRVENHIGFTSHDAPR